MKCFYCDNINTQEVDRYEVFRRETQWSRINACDECHDKNGYGRTPGTPPVIIGDIVIAKNAQYDTKIRDYKLMNEYMFEVKHLTSTRHISPKYPQAWEEWVIHGGERLANGKWEYNVLARHLLRVYPNKNY